MYDELKGVYIEQTSMKQSMWFMRASVRPMMNWLTHAMACDLSLYVSIYHSLIQLSLIVVFLKH